MMNEDEQEILRHFDSIFNTNTIKYVKLNMPLVKNIVEKLEEDFRKPSPKYEQIRKKQVELADKLYPTFTDEQNKLFREYSQVTNQMAAVEDLQLFCFGYIMAKELDNESTIKE